ncbi:hypothetical protein HOLleu_02277 [Holothuria leucospilota]|uniref:Uncharacterized protein n=1 Tax=Holothuria leucospilota TaxID=206669 RepID=A0A9Q1CRJ3_HOLLE|nr:hypothetical protein HOLleu_02277 [Holothuria leucospilota]
MNFQKKNDPNTSFCVVFGWEIQSQILKCFFRPIVDELKKLGSEGFEWQDDQGTHLSRVFSAVFSCDAVARCLLQNFHQYNGSFGCGTCFHEGETVENGMGFTRVYPVRGVVECCTAQNTLERAVDAVRLNMVIQGVKGPTILSLLPKFDFIDGFVPEYMHSVILGVVRQFETLWLDSENHEKPFYIGKFTSTLSNLLQAIKPCSEGDRLPRCISERKFWKATEWRNFLFYSPRLLIGILPNVYLSHWWLLVFAINNLTSSSVSSLMINESRAALLKFVIKIESLYGLEHVSYNVHQLAHLSQYVTNWGPLWATSAFAFENNNQLLKKSYHGTKGIASQIVKNSLIWSELDSLSELCITSAEESVQSFYNQLSLRGCKFIHKAYYVCESCTGLGNPTVRFLHDWEKAALCEVTSITALNSKAYCFNRFVLMKKLIHSQEYSTNVRQNDSVLSLYNGKFLAVHNLVIVKESFQNPADVGTPFILGQELKPSNFSVRDADVNTNLARSYRKVLFSDALVCKPGEFKCTCLMIPHERGNFILEWPGNDLSD